jgi:hypothetical protein
MSTDDPILRLTPNQILVLVVLMVEARVLDNNELKALAGFSLTGTDNAKLEKLELVETDRSHRPFSHQLTEKGWRVVRELPSAEPPKEGKSASRTLFTVLANLNRSLDRLHVSHGEFFKQTAGTPVPPVDKPTIAEVEELIRAAYGELARATGNWVGLADLRGRLGNLDRASVDEALRAMVHRDDVRIIPVANSKALKPRDRAAAVRIGDEDNHMMAIGMT